MMLVAGGCLYRLCNQLDLRDLCRLLESLPKSLDTLLSQASQASAAKGFTALPRVAAHHKAVQQELILGEADEWQGLLVGLLPSLKQVDLDCFPCYTHKAAIHADTVDPEVDLVSVLMH